VEPPVPPNREADDPEDPDVAADPMVAASVEAPRPDDGAPDGSAEPNCAATGASPEPDSTGMPDGALRPHSSQ
jgi:hypothetical protein